MAGKEVLDAVMVIVLGVSFVLKCCLGDNIALALSLIIANLSILWLVYGKGSVVLYPMICLLQSSCLFAHLALVEVFSAHHPSSVAYALLVIFHLPFGLVGCIHEFLGELERGILLALKQCFHLCVPPALGIWYPNCKGTQVVIFCFELLHKMFKFLTLLTPNCLGRNSHLGIKADGADINNGMPMGP